MRPKDLYCKQDTDHLGPRYTYPASTPEKDKGDYTTKYYIFESMGVVGYESSLMIYQVHKTLVHIDGAVGELDPIIRPGKLDVHTQVQGERFRVDLKLG